MTEPERDPACYRHDCPATNHCDKHQAHHCVDSMAAWCAKRAKREANG